MDRSGGRRRSRTTHLPRNLRRIGRRLRRGLALRNIAVLAVLVASVVVVLGAVLGPPSRGPTYRTAAVLRAMGVPDDKATPTRLAGADIPSLSVSPRFVLPVLRNDSKRLLAVAPPAPAAPEPVVAALPAAAETAPALPEPAVAALPPATLPPPLVAPEPVAVAAAPPAVETAPPSPAASEPVVAALPPAAPALPPSLAAPEPEVAALPPDLLPVPQSNPETAVPAVPPNAAVVVPATRPPSAMPPGTAPAVKAPQYAAKPRTPAPLTTAVVISPVLPHSAMPRPASGAMLAIVVDDMGPAVGLTRRAIRLPAPITLSFLPYADDIDALTAEAQSHGHEIFLHLPMEPIGTPDPGPNAILVGLDPGELQRRLAWAFDRVPRATGMNNHMGSRASSDPATMLKVLQEARRHGLSFVDSRTSPLSVGDALAAQLGLPHAARDVFLDNEPSTNAILRQLAEAERDARRRGYALAIGHPYPTTLAVLDTWLPAAQARGLRIVSAGELIASKRCRQPEAVTVSACAGGDCQLPPAC